MPADIWYYVSHGGGGHYWAIFHHVYFMMIYKCSHILKHLLHLYSCISSLMPKHRNNRRMLIMIHWQAARTWDLSVSLAMPVYFCFYIINSSAWFTITKSPVKHTLRRPKRAWIDESDWSLATSAAYHLGIRRRPTALIFTSHFYRRVALSLMHDQI